MKRSIWNNWKELLYLYGLKQVPKTWHEKFDIAILSNRFIHNTADQYFYTKVCDEYVVFVCLYVDDMLIVSNDMRKVTKMKKFPSFTFKMNDLGQVDTILGINIPKDSGDYVLSESHYIKKVLNKFTHLKIKKIKIKNKKQTSLLT